MRLYAPFVLGLIAALTAAAPAHGISRAKADKVAVRALEPPATDVLFRLPKPLPKGAAVIDYGSGPKRVRPLKARTWLYWLDQDPGARFEHASVMLLVDDRRGRVVERDRMRYWPGIVRKGSKKAARPPWLANPKAYRAGRYRAFPKASASARDPFPADPMRHLAQAPVLGAQDFKDDCLVQVGNRTEAMFQGDFDAMASWADKVGLQQRRVDGRSGLSAAVGGFTTLGCKDVFLQISGHGTPAGGGAPPAVAVHREVLVRQAGGFWETTYKKEQITAGFLSALLEEHKDTTFKIKIDACYSGRFALLDRHPNLLVLEVAASATEVAYSNLVEVEDATTNIFDAGEFTNGNVAGLTRWSTSAEEVKAHGRTLHEGIARSFELGKDQDFARTNGRTHPELYTNPPPGAPPAPGGPAPPQVSLSNPGYSHKSPGDPPQQYPSSVCSDIDSNRPGATASVTMSPAQGQEAKAVALDASGKGYVKFGIQQPDTDYTLTVTLEGISESKTVHAGPYPPADESRPCP